jgi:hypothetical protein
MEYLLNLLSVILVELSGRLELPIVRFVIIVLRDSIIIVFGWEHVLEEEIINISFIFY